MVRLAGYHLFAFCMLVGASPGAYSCGESMFRVGFGVEIPAGTVAQSANIVIFKASDAESDVFFDDSKVSSKLNKAGHSVSLAESPAKVGVQNVDIVIAREDQIANARATLGDRVANAVFLPVREGWFSRPAAGSDLSLSSNARLNQILGVLQIALGRGSN